MSTAEKCRSEVEHGGTIPGSVNGIRILSLFSHHHFKILSLGLLQEWAHLSAWLQRGETEVIAFSFCILLLVNIGKEYLLQLNGFFVFIF
jgi:hypothetical protein